jgi:hypothetical protein
MKSEEATLKASFDEWIIRIMCFNFGIAPTPFINAVNRATAFTAQEEARDEGLGPTLTFIKSLMDTVIHKALKLEGVEFKWSMEAENDPETQATIDNTMVRAGLRTPNELRQRDGLDAIEGGDVAIIYTGQGGVPLKSVADGSAMQQTPPTPGDAPPPGEQAAPGQSNKVPKAASKEAGKKSNTTPDGKSVANDKPDAPLATAKKGGGAESSEPFRKGSFAYPRHIFHSPKAAAAQARLVKASRANRKTNSAKHVEDY